MKVTCIVVSSNGYVHISDGIIGTLITVIMPGFLKSNAKFEILGWNNLIHSKPPILANQLPLLV